MVRPNESVDGVTWLSAATNNTGRVGFEAKSMKCAMQLHNLEAIVA